MNSSLVSSLFFGLALTIALSVLTALGALQSANLVMVDRLFHLYPNQQPTPPVLLVSADEADPTTLANLVRELKTYKPRGIYVLGYWPRSVEQALAAIPDITLVEATSSLRHNEPRKSLPPGAARREFMTHVSLKAGHYRNWQVSETIEAAPYTGFQAELAPPVEHVPAIIDFSMEDGFLPLIQASRVLEQGLPAALIQDKFVLVGTALRPGSPGYSVPIRQLQGMSELELQGYVLHSALAGRMLNFGSPIYTIAGTLLIGIVSIFLFQWLPSHISALLAIVSCLFIASAQWAAIKFGTLILPAWELIIAQLATLMSVHQLQRNREEKTLNSIIAKTSSRLSERVQPANFNRSDDPWKKILGLVNQQLNIKRSIFLEKVPADHRVKEIESLNCDIGDISERRRDYERQPYSDALEANAPIQPFRDYFTEVEDGEAQYIVPLSFSGDVLGFWALSLIPAKNWNRTAFESNVRSFATQIAELLYHRQHWHSRQQKSEAKWRKLLSVEAGLKLHRQLTHTVDLLENRLDILEDVLNGLSTAVVVYDIFGQVLQTNSIIEHLARDNDVAVYQLTAMELLAQSNGIHLDEARNKLRYVTLKHQTLVQSSTLFSNRGSYLLYIRPLLVKQESTTDQVQPFQIRGILFEFADLTQVQQHDEIRQDIADQYFQQMRSNLSSIGFSAENLASIDAGQQTAGYSQWLNTIGERISESNLLTDRVEQELRNQVHMREQTVPTNIVPIVKRMIDDAREAALAKELSFEYQPPASNSLNFVEPKAFEQLIAALLELLIADAAHRTVIRVVIDDREKSNIHVVLASNGHGMPKEQLDQTLSIYKSYLDMGEDPITQVSVLSQQVLLWGGEVSFVSDIGEGFSIDIKLKTFNLSVSAYEA